MKPRDVAMQGILFAQLPTEWSPVPKGIEHRPYERTVFRWPPGAGPGQNVMPIGQITLAALGSHPGSIEIHGGGCQIGCDAKDTQAAIDHVIAWINR